ncbi:hypothetical protein ACU4GR_00915 [Methylobacterium oryzae CBMB20]
MSLLDSTAAAMLAGFVRKTERQGARITVVGARLSHPRSASRGPVVADLTRVSTTFANRIRKGDLAYGHLQCPHAGVPSGHSGDRRTSDNGAAQAYEPPASTVSASEIHLTRAGWPQWADFVEELRGGASSTIQSNA